MRLTQSILVIADISGYTAFIKNREVSLLHAEQIIADLLAAVVEGCAHPLILNKFEGDALLLYAEINGDAGAAALDVYAQVWRFFHSFHQQRLAQQESRAHCQCDACANISNLSLKAILHVGEIAIRSWRQFTELAGEPLILIHRLLKNPVPAREYLLLTEEFRLVSGLHVGEPLDCPVDGLDDARIYWLPAPEWSTSAVPAPTSAVPPTAARASANAPAAAVRAPATLSARILVTLGLLMFGLGVPILEINATHVFNPQWPAHARLHEVWQLATNSSLALLCLWLVWIRHELRLAAILSTLVTGGFFVAYALRDGYQGSMVLTDGSEKSLLGLNLGLAAFGLAILCAWGAVLRERRGARSRPTADI
jgi:hypothetical protein